MNKTLALSIISMAMLSCANTPKDSGNLQDKPWQEIAPTEIDLNPVQMIDRDWLEVSAGKEGNMNLMTISWGTIGELWNKPVFIVYVSTSRYTHKFMEENDYRQWYERNGLGIHYMYIGEIVHVWKK